MFVRFKKRSLTQKCYHQEDPGYVLYAVLVESYRVEGKPRLRFVKHLASIRESALDSHLRRGMFWDRVTSKLEGIMVLASLSAFSIACTQIHNAGVVCQCNLKQE